MSYSDYDSNDVATAAYLAADEPDYDRPTRAEAEADENGPEDEPLRSRDELDDIDLAEDIPSRAEYTGSTCPVCGADIPPHAPDCPAGAAEQPDDIGEDF